jgi:hypothetical protein
MKPRVFFRHGVWCCSDGTVMTTGPTPDEAYRLYMACYRFAQREA